MIGPTILTMGGTHEKDHDRVNRSNSPLAFKAEGEIK